MRVSRRISWLTLGVLGIALAACTAPAPTPTPTAMSPAPTPTPTPTALPAATATPAPTASATPTPSPTAPSPSGGRALIGVPASPSTLDPQREMSDAFHRLGPGIAYSRLMRVQSGPDVALPSMGLECDLCESWRLVDPVTYEFTLRDNVRWHQEEPVNGRALIARDVVSSLQRLQDSAEAGRSEPPRFVEASAPDGRTVRVRLAFSDADALLGLALPQTKILPYELAESDEPLTSGPVIGTGPWVLREHEPGVSTIMDRNPGRACSSSTNTPGAPYAVMICVNSTSP